MNNVLIRAIIIINGLLLPVFIVYYLYHSIANNHPGGDYQPESIIVGEELEGAKRDSVALQGLTYDLPLEVYNSTNYYLPVSVLTYDLVIGHETDHREIERSSRV